MFLESNQANSHWYLETIFPKKYYEEEHKLEQSSWERHVLWTCIITSIIRSVTANEHQATVHTVHKYKYSAETATESESDICP